MGLAEYFSVTLLDSVSNHVVSIPAGKLEVRMPGKPDGRVLNDDTKARPTTDVPA